MREFIIADNQDITKAGMMFLLGRQKDTSLLLEADNKAELIQQLRLHPTAVVILDYTLFDFSGAEELMVLHERFKEADWLLFSDELSLPFLRQVLFSSMAFGVALKDNSKEEILTALQCASRKERFICNHVSNLLLAGNGSSSPTHPTIKDDLLTTAERSILKEIALGKTTKEITREPKVQRNYKDTVSRMLFREPENALSLYNALNGTGYTDASQITFNMLDNAIYMGMQKDISFLIMNEVNLYEHQSTYNLNMPLRDLFYVAELLQVYVKDQSLYSSKLIKLPTPHFVVFYNGVEEKPEKRILGLSEAFEVQTDDPELELKVTILNINPEMNEDLKEKCPVLKQYTQYVEQVRRNSASMPLEQAVEAAIEYCIRQDILKDFLLKQRAEVVKMSIFEYDEEREMELIRRDEREIGEQIGAEKERKKAEQELKKVKENLDKSQENAVQSMISLCQRLGGTKEQAIEELQGNYGQTEEQAKEKIKTYWKE